MKFKAGDLTKNLLPLAAGVIGANFITGMVKKVDKTGKFEKFAPAAAIVVGVMVSKNKKMQMLGYGLIGGGAAKLAGNFLPALAGIEDIDMSGVFGSLDIGANTLNDDLGAATLNGPNEFETVMGAGYDRY